MCMITRRFREKIIIIRENIKEKLIFNEQICVVAMATYFSTFRWCICCCPSTSKTTRNHKKTFCCNLFQVRLFFSYIDPTSSYLSAASFSPDIADDIAPKSMWAALRENNGTIRKCSSTAFKRMVMSVGFDNLKFFGQFLCPALGDRSHYQSL
jgi:hypothetical protein